MKQELIDRKVAVALDKALARGPQHGKNLRTRGRLLSAAGWFGMFYAMVLFLPAQAARAYGFVVAIAIGAFVAGYAMSFLRAGLQWPTLSRFIDADAVRAAASQDKA